MITFDCVICKKTIKGNFKPHPLKLSGKCCEKCNIIVIMERFISIGK